MTSEDTQKHAKHAPGEETEGVAQKARSWWPGYSKQRMCVISAALICSAADSLWWSVCDLGRMFGVVMGFIDTSLTVPLGNIFGPKERAAVFLDKASVVSKEGRTFMQTIITLLIQRGGACVFIVLSLKYYTRSKSKRWSKCLHDSVWMQAQTEPVANILQRWSNIS